MVNFLKRVLVVLLLVHLSQLGNAQSAEGQLLIGDAAPELRFSKWIKGTPVTKYDNNKIYVIEFWATWCGPCIRVMPHLSEMARKHKDDVIFIGYNVLEKIGSKPYDTAIPKVTDFVNGMGDKMDYNVAMDNNERYMAERWLRDAGESGIPTSFIIQEGKLVWIGHPNQIEEIISELKSGKYDLKAARTKHEQRRTQALAGFDAERKLYAPIDSAINTKDYRYAISYMKKVIDEKPQYKYLLNIKIFNTLLDYVDEKEAVQHAKDWAAVEGQNVLVNFGQSIVERENLSVETYQFGVECFKPYTMRGNNVNPLGFAYLATCYYKSKDYLKAVEAQEKAIEIAKEGLKDGRLSGVITEGTIKDFENSLKSYKEAAKI